ncbi:hypothetical protein GCM10009846_26640 [Agrococcus versicolor]|uniref:Fibronectin type-III domain-containing protein n=1 Tax=Agrococcus versicolor TaxID=501482 RepID=A0ABN3AWJ0_9MICO
MATASVTRPRRVLHALLAGVVAATTALTGALVAPAAPADAAAGPAAAPQADPAIVPPTAPRNVAIATLRDGGVRVTWQEPADWGTGTERSYTLQWQGVRTTSSTTQVVFEPTVFQVGVTYSIVVSTYTTQGAGSAAPVQYTRTGRPQAPTAVTAVPGGPGTVALDWAAPVNTGGLPITRYDVFQRQVGSGAWVPGPSGIAPTQRGAFVTGLTVGVEYEFKVVASNSVGEGSDSGTARVVVIDVPRPPTIQSYVVGDGRVDLTWEASPGAASYAVEVNQGGSGYVEWPSTISGTSGFITGLANGTFYDVRIGAINAAGRSASTSVRVQPIAPEVPDAPQSLQATLAGPERVLLQWQAPASDGRSQITSYVVQRFVQGVGWTGIGQPSGLSLEVGQEAGTTVQYRVTAVNAVGEGSPSGSVSIAAVLVPAAPQGVVATRGDGSVALSWSAVPSSAEAPVDGYVVEQRIPGGPWGASTNVAIDGTTARITGLVNGTTLELRVLAVNAAGRGAASAAVTATPATVPGVPLALQASVGGPGVVLLQWQAPTSDGGAALDVYTVERRFAGESTWRIWTITGGTSVRLGQEVGEALEYRVYARNDVGAGQPTGAVTFIAITTPAAPQDVVATGGDASVTLTWSAVPSTAAAPVDGYVVEQRIGDGEWAAPTSVAIVGTSAAITGLANGTAIELRVVAVNAAGRGPDGATVTATPATVPGAPTGLVAVAGAGQVTLTWTAPEADGGAVVSGYVVQRLVDTSWVAAASTSVVGTSATVGGLTNGVEVALRVVAVNRVGAGAASGSIAATPFTVPDAVTGLQSTPASTTVSLTWVAPAFDGGSAITAYVVEQRIAGGDWAPAAAVVTGTSAVVSGLTNGESYDLRVVPVNAAGRGAVGATVSETPYTVPDAPTGLRATAQDEALSVAWTAPAFDGGADVERYVLEIRAVGATDWTAVLADDVDGTTALVSGLVNGQAYELRVSAVNAAGAGIPSDAITAVPITVPGAPTGLAATPGDEQATLAWVAPAVTGGATIDGYVVERLVDGEWIAAAATIDGTTAVVTGLENGDVASLRVAAVNAAGTGARSATVEVSPFTTSDAPMGLVALASDGQIVVSWQAPTSLGGRDLLGYVVQQRVDGEWTVVATTTTATTVTLTALPNGVAVELRVAAVTADAGAGAFTAPVAATPFAFAPTVVGPTGAPLAGATLRGGDVVTVTAQGLPTGARVVVELRSTPVELASVLVGADGVLRVQARIPADATVGAHELVVLLTGEDLVFAPSVTAFAIEATPVAPTPSAPAPTAGGSSSGGSSHGGPSSGTATLPRTGAEGLLPMLLLAFALLGAGVAVRRRTAVRER